MTFFVPRSQPGDDGAWPNASSTVRFPPPLDWRADRSRPQDPPANDAALLLSAGLPAAILQRLRALALRWGVPLGKAALSVGAVKPDAYLGALADRCQFPTASDEQAIKLRPSDILPQPHRHLSAPLPMPLDAPSGMAALNGEQLSQEAAQDLARRLGPAKERVVLVGRRALGDAIAKAHGTSLAREAENGLMRKQPGFSAALGINRWQTTCLTLLVGLFGGAVIFAPRETLLIYSAALSLMFLITISLRAAAAGYTAYARTCRRTKRIPRLKEADLPRYTALVAMYREAPVLPQLVAALEALDYPALGSKSTKN